MKAIKKFFKGIVGKVDHDEIENYYGHGTREHKGNDPQAESQTTYQCPMKCEGDKTYDKPGDCPVCNMHLAPVKK